MNQSTIAAPDWSTIPAPVDDDAAPHLVGATMRSVPLKGTDGRVIDLAALPGRTVVYAYPRTGTPGVDNPPGWDMIPGARSSRAAASAVQHSVRRRPQADARHELADIRGERDDSVEALHARHRRRHRDAHLLSGFPA